MHRRALFVRLPLLAGLSLLAVSAPFTLASPAHAIIASQQSEFEAKVVALEASRDPWRRVRFEVEFG